ncbi:hypothetical protein FQN52_005954 [Onygenales sp. PD_12]|nr:hypothetical protein FQN52_005954 [Onygenales sp. PD_12]
MPAFKSTMSSSSMASTKPTILNRPEGNVRRKYQRSSSWSAWAAAPPVPKGGSMSYRSSSVGRPVNRDIAALSGKQKAAGKRGSFRRWGKRREKKSVTFDDDLDSAGTVRRQKGPAPVLVSGIIPRANPEGIQSRDEGAFMYKHTADEPIPLPGSWVDAPDTAQDSANTKYWSGIRQELEADAKFREQQNQRRGSQANRNEPRMNEHGNSHQRTVSRDDHLTARGANPRTGVVSPSLMSGSANSGSRDSQEDMATIQKWRLKGNQWVSLDPNEKTPLPTPEAKETAQPVFSCLPGSQTSPRSPSSPLARSNSHLSELEDRFVVNMPSAKEPSPLTMTTQQILDFQKAIQRVQREGGTMVDPETVPTPRSVTPEGLSTPPTKLRKRLKNKLRGRKRSVTSPVSPGSDKQDTNRDNGHSAVVPSNNLAAHVESCYSDDLPPLPTPQPSCGKSNGDNGGAVPNIPSHNAQNARQEPFLGQGAGPEDPFYPNKTSGPNTEILSRYPSLPWMNASHLSMEEYEMFLQTLPKELAIHEELLRQNQSRHSLTAPEMFPGYQTPKAHLRTTTTTTSPGQNEHPQSGPTHMQRPLKCGPHRHENQSTTTITMTPMSTPISTTIPIDLPIDLPVAIPCHHKPGPDSSLQGPVYPPFGTCGTQQQYHSHFHASNKNAEPRKVGLNEGISLGVEKIVPTVRANTHGSIPMQGSLSRDDEMRLPPDCDQRISKSSTDTSKLDSSPMGFQTTSISLGGTWPRSGPSIHREMGFPQKMMESDSENTSSLEAERLSELITAGNGNRDIKTVPFRDPVGDQGGLSFLDALIVVIQLIFSAFRDHQTIHGLRQVITHLLTMSSHCLKVTLNLCDCCHEFSKTGVLPRLPRNLNETGRLLVDGGRAGVYLFIMAVVATVLGRALGLLAMGVGWLAWIMKFWGWI